MKLDVLMSARPPNALARENSSLRFTSLEQKRLDGKSEDGETVKEYHQQNHSEEILHSQRRRRLKEEEEEEEEEKKKIMS